MTVVTALVALLLLLAAAGRACYEDCTSNAQCLQWNSADGCRLCSYFSHGKYKCQGMTTFCGTRCNPGAPGGDCGWHYRTCTVCDASNTTCVPPQETCGKRCATSAQCTGQRCYACMDGECRANDNMCGASCANRSDCNGLDPNEACFVCDMTTSKCIRPACGSVCYQDDDCNAGGCNFCNNGRCAAANLTCGMRCDPQRNECVGSCFLCLPASAGSSHNTCQKPTPTPDGCGEYCGPGGFSCDNNQNCNYCDDSDTCTEFAVAAKTGRLRPADALKAQRSQGKK